mmetsp:Transcript_84770/g.164432  ORF Transcript_84770/g.164432 Transcript_84770/m.164432 type:complete len:213 (+) Transcript_84770:362-1000(+)
MPLGPPLPRGAGAQRPRERGLGERRAPDLAAHASRGPRRQALRMGLQVPRRPKRVSVRRARVLQLRRLRPRHSQRLRLHPRPLRKGWVRGLQVFGAGAVGQGDERHRVQRVERDHPVLQHGLQRVCREARARPLPARACFGHRRRQRVCVPQLKQRSVHVRVCQKPGSVRRGLGSAGRLPGPDGGDLVQAALLGRKRVHGSRPPSLRHPRAL